MPRTLKQRIFFGSVGGLLVAILLAWVGQRVHVQGVSKKIDVHQEHAVAASGEFIRSEFDKTQREMKVVASEVVQFIENHQLPPENIPSPSLIQGLGTIELPDQWSISVYDMEMSLLAWQGESIPLATIQSLRHTDWRIVRDNGWRTALVLWEPVFEGDTFIGSIRVTQNLFARAPVRNSVLEDYDIVDTWKRRTGLEIQVAFGDTLGDYPLRSLNGKALASYVVMPPSESRLIEATSSIYSNLMALGAALLVLGLVYGIWRWIQCNLNLFRLVVFSVVLILGRITWLYLEVPARYQTGKAPLSPLFDPVHFASALGFGLMRSTGDLLISALCVFFLGFATMRYSNAFSGSSVQRPETVWIRFGCVILIGLTLASILMQVLYAIVLDSTLSYTGRSILIPGSLELVVYVSLVLMALGILLIGSAGIRTALTLRPNRIGLAVLGSCTLMMVFLLDRFQWCSWILSFSLIIAWVYLAIGARKGDIYAWLTVRRAIPAALGICLLLYPVYYSAIDQRKRDRAAYAVSTFDRSGRPDVSLAVREIVEKSLQSSLLLDSLAVGGDLEAEVKKLLSGSLLSSLGTIDADLTFLTASGEKIFQHGSPELSSKTTAELLTELSSEIELQSSDYIYVEPQSMEAARYQYAGLAAIGNKWILVRAQPHIVSEEANTPLLRVLTASGYMDLYEDLSMALYRSGQLVRAFGDRFAKYRLDPEIETILADRQSIWREESLETGRKYQTYYLRQGSDIIAARMATDGAFDHLYYLLRLVAGGLVLCIPFCTVGIVIQWRNGLIPRERLRYQDKVLNAFLVLAVVAVIPVGIAGYSVVAEENEKAVKSWLGQHLERVESTLLPEGRVDINHATALERRNIDSLSTRAGLDLNLYRGTQLVAASRRQLIEDRIVDKRIPAEVYRAIYGGAERFTFVDHKLGEFQYTAGYRAILDTNGDPVYILSVPALPEAQRIDEERTRTLAYLFGAMLGLGILVMFTSSILARALARPIARLQQGLEEASQGKFERVLPVESRDEIGALVKTFNTMQGQLSESRQKLARQQRQLAWREMARQIAHEIKNPLTPMKLSIQLLQRSFNSKEEERFEKQFHRTTSTLVAQIDSLAHIANEFSSFAQLPRRKVTILDLRTVMREAHVLMRAEASSEIALDLDLSDYPLPVMGDPNELRRTYINLIKNALEAVRSQKTQRITVVARREGNQIITEVIDTGSGIPEDVQDRIFEPSFSTKTSGTGIGLAIAKQAIELSGGHIHFTTELGQGTTMQVTLPFNHEGNENLQET